MNSGHYPQVLDFLGYEGLKDLDAFAVGSMKEADRPFFIFQEERMS